METSYQNSATTLNVKKPFHLGEYFKAYKWINWFGLVAFLCFTFTVCVIISNYVSQLQEGGNAIWKGLDKFTGQSNILIWLFMLFWIFFPNHSFLKKNYWLISTTVYITFTLIGYNLLLIPLQGGYGFKFENGQVVSLNWKPFTIFDDLWKHLFCPLIFISFAICLMYTKKNECPNSFIDVLWKGMIYPTIYCIYAVTIPFVLYDVDPATGEQVTYSVYGVATNVKDDPIAWAYVCGMYFIFFPGAYATYYFVWKKVLSKK